MNDQPDRHAGLRPWQHGVAFLFACAIVIARRPDAIFHPQFFAEDGHVWFADAYNLGWWTALFQAHTGYFQTLPRLAAALALFVPLTMAPLALNLVAVAIQALPVNLLLSSRSGGWGGLRFRTLLAGIYLALPNCGELSFGVTESQWLLALSAFLLLVAATPRSIGGELFDLTMLSLCGLTGAFCILLLPIALFLAFRHRDRVRWVQASLLAALCLLQGWALLIVDPSGRLRPEMGASVGLFARILGGQVFLGTLLGGNWLASYSSPGLLIFFFCLSIGGIALVAMSSIASPLQFRLFLLLSTVVFLLALIAPSGSVPEGVSSWSNLAASPSARYWFFPTLAFAWSLVWCFKSRMTVLKYVSAFLLLLMCIGTVRDWRHPAFKDLHFAEYAKRFESAPAGQGVSIPINPEGWNMRLVKRSPVP